MPIISLGRSNPLVDGRQSERAMEIRNGMMRHLAKFNMSALAEISLSNGRRADLLAIDRKGIITIIEIKSSVEDFKVDQKWHEYKDFCDKFTFATHPEVPEDIFPISEGLIVADNFGAEIIRDANVEKIAPATRKAVTLRFARMAAHRLEKVTQYGLANGLDFPNTDDQELD